MHSAAYVPAAITFVRPAAHVCVRELSAKVLMVTGRKGKFKQVLKCPGNGEVSQEPAILRPISWDRMIWIILYSFHLAYWIFPAWGINIGTGCKEWTRVNIAWAGFYHISWLLISSSLEMLVTVQHKEEWHNSTEHFCVVSNNKTIKLVCWLSGCRVFTVIKGLWT